MILVLLATVVAQGQITIGGNVYGGGNKGNVDGSTKVTVYKGDLNMVFGGARMANVGGNAYVNIDGKNASGYMLINYVYGGNDISGTIGENPNAVKTLPAELVGNKDNVTTAWNSFVHISSKTTSDNVYFTSEDASTYNTSHALTEGDNGYATTDFVKTPSEVSSENQKIFIGQLFGGGNGDYIYEGDDGKPLMDGDNFIVQRLVKNSAGQNVYTTIATNTKAFNRPVLDRTYLDVQGGSIAFAYGGGNNATVKKEAVIHVDNPSDVVTAINVDEDGNEVTTGGTDLLTANNSYRVKNLMNIRMAQENIDSPDFQIGRMFGGNNKAAMDIMPTWNLQRGKIRNLYSGGNRGDMTSPVGLLLEIDPKATDLAVRRKLKIDNVYGGCRMADVRPTDPETGDYIPVDNLPGHNFPKELSARVLIRGGDINNVYGGNDVKGIVYGGNAVGIYSNVSGDVYGGGNGAYAYTDMLSEDDEDWGDFSYSGELNDNRPNAEQVSIRLAGKEETVNGSKVITPTVIHGSVYVGGNCASLATQKAKPLVELKIGSHVKADKVFLGNNGARMVDPEILAKYADRTYSSLQLNDDESVFANYMDGVTMKLQPSIVFDRTDIGDPADYQDFSSYIGSFYCGGNVGSMAIGGKSTYEVHRGLIIFEKFVAGCNNADVLVQTATIDGEKVPLNTAFEGGVLGSETEQELDNDLEHFTHYYDIVDGEKQIKDRLELNLDSLLFIPMRWDDTFIEVTTSTTDYIDTEDGHSTLKKGREYYTTRFRSSKFIADGTETVPSSGKTYYVLPNPSEELVWNTVIWVTNEDDFVPTDATTTANDAKRRLLGGNVYGGCYNSGHVNGNVVININEDLIKKDELFAEADPANPYKFKDGGKRNSGVLRERQGDDSQAVSMSVFGAGYGEETEIWGSTTVNLYNGYAFQVFGGGEEGVVGKKYRKFDTSGEVYEYYQYNKAYSSTVNLKGENAGYSEKDTGEALAESEYIYGGGSEGDVCGDTYVYLGNGRVYDAFGGASNADILGHAELYVGYDGGFPWVRDNVYGGNDFGGTIKGSKDFVGEIRKSAAGNPLTFEESLVTSSTYVRYIQGRVDSIFGGCYGNYDYPDPVFKDYVYTRGETLPAGVTVGAPKEGFNFPHLDDNSFVYFRPDDNDKNKVNYIFGGSEGFPGDVDMNNAMQRESYVLIDDTETRDVDRYANVDVYGGGAFAGVGVLETGDDGKTVQDLGAGRTVVDLYKGSFRNVYGGCNQEGLVGYTRVNVPAESTIRVNAIFGGGKGYDEEDLSKDPSLVNRYCDHYVTCVDYHGTDAIVKDAIYGGNENCRIACDTYIDIGAPVNQGNGYQGTVYGAGYGKKTVCGRTNVFMNENSNAYKVFGGGRDGNAFNFATLRKWLAAQFIAGGTAAADIEGKLTEYGDILRTFGTYLVKHPISLPTHIGTYPNSSGVYDGKYTNDILESTAYHQTNVHLMEGSNVTGYAYGGGYGSDAIVSGTTYIELKGGNVERDVYGGGQGGHVYDEYRLSKLSTNDAFYSDFVAKTNVYIEGGMARNVYGGGYQGHVGKHDGDISTSYANDIPGVANVVIGKTDGTSFVNGIPAILRNAYGAGEGGSVYGTTNVTLNNGYIGYRYKNTGTAQSPVYKYVEELDDQTTNAIELSGNIFGGGYVVNSYVDIANVDLFGGTVRGSVYGGGEVGPVGRGTIRYASTETTGSIRNGAARIYKAGKTHVRMFNGHVLRNVFGGGRGKDSWGGDGTKYMRDNMSAEAFAALDLNCKGYVFGQTEVDIHGGEVGTDEGMARSFGNVFGGCDEGTVYSAYEDNEGHLCYGKKDGERYGESKYQGYYYKYEKTNDTWGFVTTSNDEREFTEDCKVLVEPWLQVKNAAITYDGKTYKVGDYIPTAYLNTLPAKARGATAWPTGWDNVDAGTSEEKDGKLIITERGVVIHNAVFAGGNIASGSSSMSASEKTVFGNATASIHDVYNRDLITIGTGHTGGLYGDGNLTFVDGYRELNITNYGSDYYHIEEQLTKSEYDRLPDREKAYYEVKYTCKTACVDNEQNSYAVGASLPLDELLVLFEGRTEMIDSEGKPNSTYWQENGVVSTYAGRIMNTIQRADFCGVFGSRMVMKGARDRVPEEVDYTNYTINRVREVSLNKKLSSAGDTGLNAMHGNYFGIYSIVNYLGALTSDVDFHTAYRTTDNQDKTSYGPDDLTKMTITATPAAQEAISSMNVAGVTVNNDGTVTVNSTEALNQIRNVEGVTISSTQTFYDWKAKHYNERKRNNGTSYNQVALASGVYLELTTEQSRGTAVDEKDWGLITGVIELDLINVQPGIGGGFVYAKNQHGTPRKTNYQNTTLTALNEDAATRWDYEYDDTQTTGSGDETTTSNVQKEWETSGNFIHSTQTIIDDCYNESGRYKVGENPVPAHYWFISGLVYVYDQYISAYTGAPNAYKETVEIPITINAASNGSMTLMDVQPNLYAYYSYYASETENTKLEGDRKVMIGEVEYKLNDPISYWDWNKLPAAEKKWFVKDTYVVVQDCKIGNTEYKAGTVLLPESTNASVATYKSLKNSAPTKQFSEEENAPYEPYVTLVVRDVEGNIVEGEGEDVPFTDVFRSSNNMSHEKGYLLTYSVTNPGLWKPWYTKTPSSVREKSQNVTEGTAGWENGPTYHPIDDGLYGQKQYAVNDIIPAKIHDDYESLGENKPSSDNQATFVPAHILTKEYITDSQHYYQGAPVAAEISGYTAPAYVCTSTIKLSDTEFIYVNDLMTEAQKDAYYNRFQKTGATAAEELIATDIKDLIKPAYICTKAGLYGGDYYVTANNYRALEAWSSMSDAERLKFEFNYDALDLLIDSSYGTDPTYGNSVGRRYQYDGKNFRTATEADTNDAQYSLKTPIDYTATYNGTSDLTYTDASNNSKTVAPNAELQRAEYESLPNEKRHYAPIAVAATGGPYYVVNTDFVHIETPYAVGATMSNEAYGKLSTTEKENVTVLTFTTDDLPTDINGNPVATTFYYCRENYKVNEKGEGREVTSVKGVSGTYTSSTAGGVPVGVVIDAANYALLPNKQQNFTIHGISPMETSTLYVSRQADIKDLSKEKIITVIYKYDYEESDETGMHITPISERHVVNIHITFESGVPTVEDIREPGTVLPGTSISMNPPHVSEGAYEILGGGWELFENKEDAESHVNGTPYTLSKDSLYWYQDGFFLAYYAKTYLGKTYSNYVPVSVANYHDLKRVMDDKNFHLHVDYDRSRLKRDPKIYIKDYSNSSENGLDLFKNLFDLSLISGSDNGYTVTDGVITNTASPANSELKGHALLNISTDTATNIYDEQQYQKGVKGGKNLEFFLRTDIDHGPTPNPDYNPETPGSQQTISHPWTPIGTEDDPSTTGVDEEQCFEGTLHGDGHTISGLDNSLFKNLCGNVYNLGVTGSFKSAGVVDMGTGYVESAWVKSSATESLSTKPNAVFGSPSDTEGYQLVNAYFWDGNEDLYNTETTYGVITSGGVLGKARAMADSAFYNGGLAYHLNNFYLHKRYSLKEGTVDGESMEGRYFTIGDDDQLTLQPYRSYPNSPDLCSTGFVDTNQNTIRYVEDRFADGDFIYDHADGDVTNTDNERLVVETVTVNGKETQVSNYYPIWPDDYIFFGQKLTYGYSTTEAHQEVPTAVVRAASGRLSLDTDANRVFRAPAFYRSKTQGAAYFNPNAYLAQTENPETVPAGKTPRKAYPNMTAIDFAGHNNNNEVTGTYSLGFTGGGLFYPPLLDDDGLQSIANKDETPNLVVYAPAASSTGDSYANEKTYTVLNGYFVEPEFNAFWDRKNTMGRYTDDKVYDRVASATDKSVYGHLVQSDLTATNDHMLVDKEDFNAPYGYQFDGSHRMWYQREPDKQEYVDLAKGWQGISLPFTAELVTTDDKGEITHFFEGSSTGHEYWLRKFSGISGENSPEVAKADFTYISSGDGEKKDRTFDDAVTNTFLWDYYYQNVSVHNQKDANADTYQTYYSKERSYPDYPLLTAGTPYIIGLPGKTYYEFDLSGSFKAENTAVTIDKLKKQVITFASDTGIGIGVSDDEMAGVSNSYTKDGIKVTFTFKPSYMNNETAVGNFVMNTDGDAYKEVSETDATNTTNKVSKSQKAFRPYFVKTTGPADTRTIVFGNDQSEEKGVEEHGDPKEEELNGGLNIWSKKDKIYVQSSLSFTEDLRVVTPAGITVATFTVKPGQTVEVQADFSGMYVVHTLDGLYTKKVVVKRE